jgi:hypothetical protein
MHNHSNLESKILKSIRYQKKIKTKNHSSLNLNEAGYHAQHNSHASYRETIVSLALKRFTSKAQ